MPTTLYKCFHRDPEKRDNKCIKATCGLSTVSIFFAVGTLIFTIVISIQRNEENTALVDREVCIERSAFGAHNFETQIKTRDIDGVVKVCFPNNQELIKEVENARASQAIKIQYAPSQTSVAAHRYFHSADKPTICPEGNKQCNYTLTFDPVNLDPTKEISHLNVSVQRDSMEIVYTGMYYVYSNFNFMDKSSSETRDCHTKTRHHYVHKTNRISSHVLLKTHHTVCDDSEYQETAFTGGVFYLVTGDKLQVTASMKNVSDFGKETSYLGVVLLNNVG
ncbi:uncharacterized protein LOC131944586 [Physella acuta]|uniref:uncharacterized protein LOC131944586 n=1 Tax=Physella acuta TaxID=109671 RepID=UPI0027DC88C3|nr:uncharacterized protein LOC131944586 [Physella acuta]